MAKGLKKAFDLDRRRSASPRGRQASPRQRRDESRRATSPRPGRQQSRAAFHGPRGQPNRGPRYSRWPGRHDYRAADLTQRGLPVHTPSGPSRRAINPAAVTKKKKTKMKMNLTPRVWGTTGITVT